jgi:hypothetical protein
MRDAHFKYLKWEYVLQSHWRWRTSTGTLEWMQALWAALVRLSANTRLCERDCKSDSGRIVLEKGTQERGHGKCFRLAKEWNDSQVWVGCNVHRLGVCVGPCVSVLWRTVYVYDAVKYVYFEGLSGVFTCVRTGVSSWTTILAG